MQDRDPQGLNVNRMDCAQVTESDIWNQIVASPFLAEKRMVVLVGCIASKHEQLRAELLTKMQEKSLPESTILVFWESEYSFKKKEQKEFFARLSTEKYAQEFDELQGAKLAGWIAAEVVERGSRIEPQAAQFLAQSAAGGTWGCSMRIDQLCAYTGGKRAIAVADVQLFVDQKIDDSIFTLVDAIVAKQAKTVFSAMQEQYAQGKDALYIFAMLLRQFRILIEMRDVFDRDIATHSNDMAKELGIHPFVAKKSLPMVKRYSMDLLTQVYTKLLELDIKIKTGQDDQRVLMDLFVASYCSD